MLRGFQEDFRRVSGELKDIQRSFRGISRGSKLSSRRLHGDSKRLERSSFRGMTLTMNKAFQRVFKGLQKSFREVPEG